MKAAPVKRALGKWPAVRQNLVHTGQHYDKNLSDVFFSQLNMPEPDVNLEVGSGSRAWQTAEVMKRPSVTLRPSTEDPVTLISLTNLLVGHDLGLLNSEVARILEGKGKRGSIRSLWHGHISERIAQILQGNSAAAAGEP